MAKLGFIGLGVMGGNMVARLLEKGHTVTGYNRTRSKAQWLIDKGMKFAESPKGVAAASDVATALADASVGTVFAPRPERMSARRFWVRYAAESAGALTLDDGAVRAVVRQRRSLLPAGITALSGRFYGGDVVELRAPDATMVARGVVAYDHAELATMLGRSTSDLPADMRRPAVHADDLVAV